MILIRISCPKVRKHQNLVSTALVPVLVEPATDQQSKSPPAQLLLIRQSKLCQIKISRNYAQKKTRMNRENTLTDLN